MKLQMNKSYISFMSKENLRTKKKKLLVAVSKVLLTLFLVTFLSFLLVQLSPIDPAEAYVRRHMAQAEEQTIETLREKMGLNRPLIVQYADWVTDALSLDFGTSLVSGKHVLDEFVKAFPYTLKMVLISAVIQGIVAIFLGCLLYMYKDSLLYSVIKFLTIVALSLPTFYIGAMYLHIFASELGWIPVLTTSGFSRYLHPAICLSIPSTALFARMIGKSLIKEMEQEYILYARCRGLKEKRILSFYGLPHTLRGLIPSFMQNIGLLMAASGIVEVIFSFPGIGSVIINSIIDRDAPMIHSAVLFLAVVFIFSDFLAILFNNVLLKNNSQLKGGVL